MTAYQSRRGRFIDVLGDLIAAKCRAELGDRGGALERLSSAVDGAQLLWAELEAEQVRVEASAPGGGPL